MQLYTIPEVADILCVSRGFVYKRIADGSLKTIDIGKGRPFKRVTDAAIEAYLDDCTPDDRPQVTP